MGELLQAGTLLQVGGVIIVAVAIWFFLLRSPEAAATAEDLPPTPDAVATVEPTPTLEPLPEVSEDALRAIGANGGALELGRPSLLELHYAGSGEVVALPIDPALVTPQGELRYQQAVMLSASPLAVWLANSRLNYALGIPPASVAALAVGDRAVISSNTGAVIAFTITGTDRVASYEAIDLFTQDHIGITLFALPAAGDDDVRVAFGAYDVAQEDARSAPQYGVGDAVPLADRTATIGYLHADHLPDGRIQYRVGGMVSDGGDAPQTLLLSVGAGAYRSGATDLFVAADGAWQAAFVLPPDAAGTAAVAELRALPSGATGTVRLGPIPVLADRLQTTPSAYWDAESSAVRLDLMVANPADNGRARLDGDYVTVTEGGEIVSRMQLPAMVEPGAAITLSALIRPDLDAPLVVRIGDELWQIQIDTQTSITK